MATVKTYGPQPGTTRGRATLIGGHADSQQIAYCNGRNVILRSLADPMKCTVYSEHQHPTTVARFSPNGEWVASGDVSGTVRVWPAEPDHKLKLEIQAIAGSVDDLQWSADGTRIVAVGDSRGVQAKAFMWDSGNNVGDFSGMSKRVNSCDFRPTRPFRIACGGDDFHTHIFEGPPFKFKGSAAGHTNFVNCVRYAPDGSKYVSVGSDGKGVLYDGATGEIVGELPKDGGHTGTIYAAAWSPDGTQLLTAGADKTARLWDLGGGSAKVTTTFSFSDKPAVGDMQVGALWCGDHLVTISLCGDINLLDTNSPSRPKSVIRGHQKAITAMVAAADEGALHTGDTDGVVGEMRVGSGWQSTAALHPSQVEAMALQATSLITCGADDTVRVSPLPASVATAGAPAPVGSSPAGLSTDPSGDLCAIATDKGVVLVRGGAVVSTTQTDYEATAVAVKAGGGEVAVGGSDNKVHIYTVSGTGLSESPKSPLEKHRSPITALAYSPDGAMLASGDAGREAAVWDAATWEVKMSRMVFHTARITCCAWCPDSVRVATGSLDTGAIVWDTTKGAMDRLQIKGAHAGGVGGVAWLGPHTLATAGADGVVRTWALPEP